MALCSRRFAVKLAVYLLVGTVFKVFNMWSWLYEPHGNKCKHEPLPANTSGVKVLVYGMAKTGTTAAVRALYDIGLNAYKNEEWNFHVWAPLMDEYYYRPENGGKLFGWARLATPLGPAWKGHAFWPRMHDGADVKLLNGITHEELAEAASRCRVDALSFDGLEATFPKMLEVSPDAKVLVLDWRAYDEYSKSAASLDVPGALAALGMNFLTVSMHILPWNMFLFPLLDPRLGDPITRLMRDGEPFHKGTLKVGNVADPFVMLWRTQLFERRVAQHQVNGARLPFATKESYEGHWKWIKGKVPEGKRFHFDPTKHGHKDLCKFLGVTGSPACELKGPLPRIAPASYESENPKWFALEAIYLMFLHLLSYNSFWAIVNGVSGWLVASRAWLRKEARPKVE